MISKTTWANLPGHIKKGNVPQKDVLMVLYEAISETHKDTQECMKRFAETINNTLLLDLQNRFNIIEERLKALEKTWLDIQNRLDIIEGRLKATDKENDDGNTSGT